jgi:hypothetical protein
MYDQSTIDELDLVYGPRKLLARYMACVSSGIRDLGLRLRISADFDRLIDLSKQQRENWPPLSPIFNPRYSDLGEDTSFLIECIDDVGDTVMTSAGRLYDHGDRSLAEDLRSLRVFYRDPAPYLATDTVTVTARSAEHIFGRTGYSGAVWVRPDYRLHGLTKVIPRLTRSVLLTRWNTPVFWATIAPNLDAGGVTRAYGSWHVEQSVTAHMPLWQGDCVVLFLSMGQATLIRDIAGSVEDYETKVGTSRWIDSAIAKRSLLPERQGMISRS